MENNICANKVPSQTTVVNYFKKTIKKNCAHLSHTQKLVIHHRNQVVLCLFYILVKRFCKETDGRLRYFFLFF